MPPDRRTARSAETVRPRGSGRAGSRAALVVVLLAGLFGMHAMTVGHVPMTMTASAAAQPTAHAMPAQQVPAPARSVVSGSSAAVAPAAASGQPSGTGSAEHTGHTVSACVAVLVAAAVLLLAAVRRLLARRRSAPLGWPAPERAVVARVAPRLVRARQALTLFELCVLRV